MRILCSTGSFVTRRNGRDCTLIPRVASQIGADGLELMMYDSWYDKIGEVAAAVQGLCVPVLHVDKQVGEKISRDTPGDRAQALHDFACNCALARQVGAGTLVLHLWNGVPSDHHFERNLSAFGELLAIAAEYGLCLTAENVVCGLSDPMTRLAQLKERYPDVRFTFDTKMAAFHGQLNQFYAPENAWLFAHTAHVHLNDYGGGLRDWEHLQVLHPGDGRLDLPRVCAFLKTQGYAGDITSEATAVLPDGTVDTDRLRRTLQWYRERL